MMVQVISAETMFITSFLKFDPLGGSTDLFNLIQSSAKQDCPGMCFTVTVFTHWVIRKENSFLRFNFTFFQGLKALA